MKFEEKKRVFINIRGKCVKNHIAYFLDSGMLMCTKTSKLCGIESCKELKKMTSSKEIYCPVINRLNLRIVSYDKPSKINEETLEALRTLDSPKTTAKLAKALGISLRNALRRIGRLREEGLIKTKMMCKGRYERFLEIKEK